jgi:hypothetical protein
MMSTSRTILHASSHLALVPCDKLYVEINGSATGSIRFFRLTTFPLLSPQWT